MSEPQVVEIEANGIKLAAASSGRESGQVLVFANSLGTDMRIWDQVLPLLPVGLRIIRYDERGNGLSDWETTDLSFDAFVDDLGSVVDAAGLEEFDLLGISQGAAVAIA